MPSGSPVAGSLFFPGRAKMRRRVRGKPREDYDGVECFTFFFPLVPRRPVHVWGWGLESISGHSFSPKRTSVYSFRAIPIRWSPELVACALLRWWLWIPLLVTLLFSFSLANGKLFGLFALVLFIGLLAAWLVVMVKVRGESRIRRLLGRHRLGFSDPATWTDDLVRLLAPPSEWFGTQTFAEAVVPLLRDRRYSEAMWAARLCLAVENQSKGRELTAHILNHSDVGTILAEITEHPQRFKELVHRRHARAFPLLRPDNSAAAAYWQSVIAFDATETFTFSIYSHSHGGLLAYADDTEEKIKERKRLGPPPPKDQLGPDTAQYRLGGCALVAAVVLGVVGFSWIATLFRGKTAAEKMIEEQQRLAANQAAPVQPAPVQPQPPAQPPPTPVWAKREAGNWQYLADMAEYDVVVAGPWTFAKDGTTGDPQQHSPIKVGGVASPKGLGMHPPDSNYSQVKYRLDGKARLFKSVGAVSDSSTILFSPLYFEVWGDGRRLWQSERITDGKQIRECSIDVADVQELELRVVAVGHHTGLHAVWLEPRVLLK